MEPALRSDGVVEAAGAAPSGSGSGLYVVVTGRFPERALGVLAGMIAMLVLASFATQVTAQLMEVEDAASWIDVDREGNLPTWISATLLALAAVLLAVIAVTPIKDKPNRWYWLVLATTFVFLSVDEALRVHETLGEWLRDAWRTEGLLRFAWIVPYGIVGLFLLLALIPFLLSLPPRTRRFFLAAGLVYVLGAAAVNAIGGSLIDSDPPRGLVGSLSHLEELLELAGIAVFIYALLDYLRSGVFIIED